jgi:DNA-binding GntR family transcriptional regulator
VIIDPQSPDHPYVQLAGYLRGQIERGEITGKVPSLTQLTEETGLSLNTVLRAIRLLKNEGVVYTVSGRGTFVKREAPRQQ